MRQLLSFILGMVVAVAVPWVALAGGWFNFTATREPGFVEGTVAPWAYDRWIESNAKAQENPIQSQSQAIAAGLEHYRGTCLQCHGAPDVKGEAFALGMSPSPPELSGSEVQELSDSELFWVIKHGVRMTGMPGFGPHHTDTELWQIVTFVRHLPELSSEETEALRGSGRTAESHHSGAGGGHDSSGHGA